MENHPRHKSNSSGDNFTFPAISPDMELDTELADHLFSNGKFLLHTFPVQPRSFTLSRTSSVSSSKDSLVSSRSNSTNSRTSSSSSSSSSCSSARTSTSDASAGVAVKSKIFLEKGSRSPVRYCNNYHHLPAQRWQFMAPVPMLNRRPSQRRKGEENRIGSPEKKKCNPKKGYCRRLFRWVVSTCKSCHAMEP